MGRDSDPMSSKPLLPPPVLIDIDRIFDPPYTARSTPYSFSSSSTEGSSTDTKDTLKSPPASPYTCTNINAIDIESQNLCRHPLLCCSSKCPTTCHSSSRTTTPHRPQTNTHFIFGFSPNPNAQDWLPFRAHFPFGLAPPSQSWPGLPQLSGQGMTLFGVVVFMLCLKAFLIVLAVVTK